ncbi:hypothetical protein ABPG75_012378 [Micractinium tetrahymenae]
MQASGGGSSSSSSSGAVLAAALAVLGQAHSVLARLEPALPDSWVQRVRTDVSAGRRRLATAQAQAQLMRAWAEDNSSDAAAAAEALAAASGAAAAAAAGAAAQPPLCRQPAQARHIPSASIALRKQAAARLASQLFGSENDLQAASVSDATLSALAPAAPALLHELYRHVGPLCDPLAGLFDSGELAHPFTPDGLLATTGPASDH